MIRILKRKFIVSAMIAVTVLLITMLGAVNAVNAWTASRETESLLEELLRLELQGRPELPEGEEGPAHPEEERVPVPPGREEGRGGLWSRPVSEDDRMAAVFFTARLRDGRLLRCDLSRISSVTEAEAAQQAQAAAASGNRSGRSGSFRWVSAADEAGETVCVFLEESGRRAAVLRVAALSALAGLGGWLLMLGLVSLLAKRTIAPVAENMERQRQFVTDAGHELKTPLAIIRANTEAMELIAGETKWSRNIKAQTERLTELTGNLLTLARAEEAPTPESLGPVALSDLAEQSARSFQAPMEQRGLRLEAELSPGLTVLGNTEQLSRLCSILFDNAVKYAAAGSVLRLRLQAEERSCVLRLENVCDRLPDCPPERLFDRFYRADAARTQDGGAQAAGGFGIGLSAARLIVRSHRGRIEAAYLPDRRIAFTVTLPAAPNAERSLKHT